MFALLFETALPNGQILLTIGLIAGFYMAWSIGANDVANAMGTSVGSKGITLKQAVIIAAIMEFVGAVFVGSHVSETVRQGIFDPSMFQPRPLVLGFIAALISSAVWLQIATYFGWPVSTTHSIVGAIIGIGIVIAGFDAINWGKVGGIVASWVTSPLAGGVISFILFKFIQKSIINSKYPVRQIYKFIPFIVFYVAFVLCLVMVWKGLKNLKLDLDLGAALLISVVCGIVCGVLSLLWVRKLKIRHEKERIERSIELTGDWEEGIPFVRKEDRDKPEPPAELRPALAPGSDLPSKRWEYRREFEFEKVEGVFTSLMVVSACFLAFAHGANDVANAVGPLAAVISITRDGVINLKSAVPTWVLAMGAVGIVIGLATWGYKVMETIGSKITQLTPSRGFAANIGAASTIVLASRLGFPISTTHTLVGAVLGVGLARGIEYLNLRMIRSIIVSWIITIPAGAIMAILFYYVLKFFFGTA
ncbi:MAG: inorganic phosphate transporter [Verrucomicrobia bacterium]|nr:inorganic phosphate transporter [Verrucomicrobiota bacterium]